MNVLRMLHAEAAVARAIGLGRVEENVEQVADCAVTDRVHGDVQSRCVGCGHPGAHVFDVVDQHAAVIPRIGERLEHGRRVRAQRTVHESLENACRQHLVAAPVLSDVVCKVLPLSERHCGVDPHREFIAGMRAPKHSEIIEAAHVVDSRDATGREVVERSA